MKKFWKTIFGKRIYQSPNGASVYQNFIYRWLTLNSDIIQTIINRHKPSKPVLLYLNSLTFVFKNIPGDVCLLGLGGGGLAHAIANSCKKLTVVEFSLDVIQIACKYFMVKTLPNLEIIHQDAKLYAQNCTKKYQHLIVDIHDSNGFPNSCTNIDFFMNCRAMLLPNGVIAINLSNQQDYITIIKILNKIFDNKTISIPIKNTANFVIVASISKTINHLLDIFAKNKSVKKLVWDSKLGYLAEL